MYNHSLLNILFLLCITKFNGFLSIYVIVLFMHVHCMSDSCERLYRCSNIAGYP